MAYAVKEIYYTLQGEGAHTGRAAVFLRFAGCNLWSGVERDRHTAICQFCDTDFVGMDGPGGGRFATARQLAKRVGEVWPDRRHSRARPYVVCTGGEPMLQLDTSLVEALHTLGFEVGIETNGTIPVSNGVDWICVSPKAGAPLVQTRGHELKLVFPQADALPEAFLGMAFDHLFLQPMDGPHREAHTRAAVEYCLRHPAWRLSLQTHKVLGIP